MPEKDTNASNILISISLAIRGNLLFAYNHNSISYEDICSNWRSR